MLLVAIVFISLALLLYSFSIFSERIKKKLQFWMILTFASAFACDLIGTSLMFMRATNRFAPNLHGLCGYAALLIMGLHLIWAIVSIKKHGRAEILFHRFSMFAWLIWLLAFISGIPKA